MDRYTPDLVKDLKKMDAEAHSAYLKWRMDKSLPLLDAVKGEKDAVNYLLSEIDSAIKIKACRGFTNEKALDPALLQLPCECCGQYSATKAGLAYFGREAVDMGKLGGAAYKRAVQEREKAALHGVIEEGEFTIEALDESISTAKGKIRAGKFRGGEMADISVDQTPSMDQTKKGTIKGKAKYYKVKNPEKLSVGEVVFVGGTPKKREQQEILEIRRMSTKRNDYQFLLEEFHHKKQAWFSGSKIYLDYEESLHEKEIQLDVWAYYSSKSKKVGADDLSPEELLVGDRSYTH